jgi:hypothetical protein
VGQETRDASATATLTPTPTATTIGPTPTATATPTATPTIVPCPNPGAGCVAGLPAVTSLAPSSAVAGDPDLYDSLQWGADDTVLYAANTEDTAFDFYSLAINSMGVASDDDYSATFSSFNDNIHFGPNQRTHLCGLRHRYKSFECAAGGHFLAKQLSDRDGA